MIDSRKGASEETATAAEEAAEASLRFAKKHSKNVK